MPLNNNSKSAGTVKKNKSDEIVTEMPETKVQAQAQLLTIEPITERVIAFADNNQRLYVYDWTEKKQRKVFETKHFAGVCVRTVRSIQLDKKGKHFMFGVTTSTSECELFELKINGDESNFDKDLDVIVTTHAKLKPLACTCYWRCIDWCRTYTGPNNKTFTLLVGGDRPELAVIDLLGANKEEDEEEELAKADALFQVEWKKLEDEEEVEAAEFEKTKSEKLKDPTLEDLKAKMTKAQKETFDQLVDVLMLPPEESAEAALRCNNSDNAASFVLSGKVHDVLAAEKKERAAASGLSPELQEIDRKKKELVRKRDEKARLRKETPFPQRGIPLDECSAIRGVVNWDDKHCFCVGEGKVSGTPKPKIHVVDFVSEAEGEKKVVQAFETPFAKRMNNIEVNHKQQIAAVSSDDGSFLVFDFAISGDPITKPWAIRYHVKVSASLLWEIGLDPTGTLVAATSGSDSSLEVVTYNISSSIYSSSSASSPSSSSVIPPKLPTRFSTRAETLGVRFSKRGNFLFTATAGSLKEAQRFKSGEGPEQRWTARRDTILRIRYFGNKNNKLQQAFEQVWNIFVLTTLYINPVNI